MKRWKMHRFEFKWPVKLVATFLTVAGIVGCGVSKRISVQNVDSSSLPSMPTPTPGHASLSGVVVDADGNPIVGANVKVAETDAIVSTDDSGTYQMMVPSDSTLTLVASATGFGNTYHDAIVLASEAEITQLDLLMLPTSKIAGMNALGGTGATAAATLGVVAVRIHSLGAECSTAGAHLSVSPSKAATLFYSRPSTTGGLDEPDATMSSVQVDAGVAAWLVGVLPPGNMLQFTVDQPGCQLLAQSPSMNGLQYVGLRRVDAQALTVAGLFLN